MATLPPGCASPKLPTQRRAKLLSAVRDEGSGIPEEFQGNRELYLVLTEFNGNPVASVPGKEVNLQFGTEPIHLRAADIEKTSLKSRQSMSMSFEPTDNLNPGTYNVMVYADSGYLGSTGFLVSK